MAQNGQGPADTTAMFNRASVLRAAAKATLAKACLEGDGEAGKSDAALAAGVTCALIDVSLHA